jgi:hypothetical protein
MLEYSDVERRIIRNQHRFPASLFDKAVHHIAKLYHLSEIGHGRGPGKQGAVYNTYHFRFLTCLFLRTLEVIGDGGNVSSVKHSKCLHLAQQLEINKHELI